MKFDKLFICGLSHSGKSLMLELLDGHKNILMCPFHEFSLSPIIQKFRDYLVSKKLFFQKYDWVDGNEDLFFDIKFNENEIHTLSAHSLLYFIFLNNASFVWILKIHLTKEYIYYSPAANKILSKHEFKFNLEKFIINLSGHIKNRKNKIFTIEELDNLILQSYINSTEYSDNQLQNIQYFMKWGSNSIAQISNLHEKYKNFKIIYVKRDIFSRAYSKAFEFINQKNYNQDSKEFKKNMIKKAIFPIARVLIIKETDYFKKMKFFTSSKKILFIDFDGLFISREYTMKKVAKFLNLEYDPKLVNPSFFGQLIDYEKFSDNQMIVSPHEYFSLKEINYFKKVINNKFLLNIFVLFYKFRKLLDNDTNK